MPIVTISDNTGATFAGSTSNNIFNATPTTVDQDSAQLQLAAVDAFTIEHVLLRFTGLSNLPASIVVNAASIAIRVSTAPVGSGMVVETNRLLRAYTPSQATWNIYSTGNNWTTAGAGGSGTDIAAAVSSTSGEIPTSSGYYDFAPDAAQLRQDIEKICSGEYANNGWRMAIASMTVPGYYNCGGITADDGRRPVLTIDYTEVAPTATRRLTLLGAGR